MNLPKEISPNPLLSSVVEFRFISNLKTEELIGKFFPILGNDFPLVSYTDLPRNIKNSDVQFKYLPDFVFSNSEYSISIGSNIISFENLNTYHFWPAYSDLIKSILDKIIDSKIIEKIERIGVRYISLFEPKYKIKDIMSINDFLNYNDFVQTNNFIQTELLKNDVRLVLRVAENGNVNIGTKQSKGLFIDIDASQVSNLPDQLNKEIYNILDILHLEEKSLFFELLETNFLKSLNPIY